MNGYFTCPDCDTRFQVPADAGGAIINCVACPWTGVPTYVDGVTEHPTHRARLTPQDMPCSSYGMHLAFLGDEDLSQGVIALGHVDKRRFTAAVNRRLREIGCETLETYVRSMEEALKLVDHCWAVNLPICPHQDPRNCLYEAECIPRAYTEGDCWNVSVDGWINAKTPGAFPVTYGAWW